MQNTLPQASDLPLRDGVSASCVQVPAGAWSSLLAFLCAQFPAIHETIWLSRFARGLVLDQTGKTLQPRDHCKTGARIYYYREVAQEIEIPFQEKILYQDEYILVADKPHFLPVVPSGVYVQQTLLTRLKRSTGIAQLSPLHRIDKDTAGLVMFSVNPHTRNAYQALFRERQVTKHYHAVARWNTAFTYPLVYRSRLVEDAQFFRTQEVEGAANSETVVSVLAQDGEKALYNLQPITGKKHQLRVHMAQLGMPIANDVLYPAVCEREAEDFSQPLQLLAKSLAFVDPITQALRYFESQQKLN
ncbi:MAG TPA: pseudouridine synthase [Pseudomonadales bacterium]|jgi:tRNA pseudouridine32 synthase/23S rRNA pseudouridine746 synthase|nr:pseudouridine synthase [Cellvibrionales bacterium]HRF87107.1 pseudouridine synthase [Pseudomonadales bacterium]HRG50199.1 pseudouridine synthase [Pseudomonadales bacterium]